MKTKALLFFLLCTAMLHASPSDTLKSSHRFFFRLNASIGYNYRLLKTNDNQMNALVNARDSMEKPIAGYSFGLTFGKELNNKLDFLFGFGLSVEGYKTIPYQLVQNGDSVGTAYIVEHINYFDIPLQLRYHPFSHHAYYFMAGISPVIFTANHFVYHIENNDGRKVTQRGSVKGYSLLNPQAMIGFGFDFPVAAGMLDVQPFFRCSVAPIVSAPVKGFLYSGGLLIGYIF